MDASNQLILLIGTLLLLSIFAGMVSTRVGAPLLVVFLALGMLAGENGPGGILFSDFQAAYTIGSAALAIILFEGGMRTPISQFRQAGLPAFVLATVGVGLSAGIVAGAIAPFSHNWVQALLMGAIVASTDAAAVFGLMRQNKVDIHKRVRATLEVESGLNDPMAIFLTLLLVTILAPNSEGAVSVGPIPFFLLQMVGGAAFGAAGGFALRGILRRIDIEAGLYPIFTLAGALMVFGAAQSVHASGFLAIYLVGLLVGHQRSKAHAGIERFLDAFAWLAQIALFLMLGLLVTPASLVEYLGPALWVAVVLMFVARPLATALCLLPFRFNWREVIFVSWVGLRGAVPIFLAIVPVLAGAPGGMAYFSVAFVVVVLSLLVQGWTLAPLARLLHLTVPAEPPPPARFDIDLPGTVEGENAVSGYAVAPNSAILARSDGALTLPGDAKVLMLLREGLALGPNAAATLVPGDYLLIRADAAYVGQIDRLFGPKSTRIADPDALLGEFTIDGSRTLDDFGKLYGVPIPEGSGGLTIATYLAEKLATLPTVGDRVRLGPIDLIVKTVEEDRIIEVGIDLEPERPPAGMERWAKITRVLREGFRFRHNRQ
ncbi:MAG: potassium/proton antiporter [Elstera sp.]